MAMESLSRNPVFVGFRGPAHVDLGVTESTFSDSGIMDCSVLNASTDNTSGDSTKDSTKLGLSGQSMSSPANGPRPGSALEDNIAFISFSGRVTPPGIQNSIDQCMAQFHQLKMCKENIAQQKLSLGEVNAIMAYAHKQLEEKAAKIATSLKSFEEETNDNIEAKHAINKSEENTERNDKDSANAIKSIFHRENTLLGESKMNGLSTGHVAARVASNPDMDEEQKAIAVQQMAQASLEGAGIEEERKLAGDNQSLDEQYQSLNKQYQSLNKQYQSLNKQYQSLNKQQKSLNDQQHGLEEKNQSLDEQLQSLKEQKQSLEEEDGQLVNNERNIKLVATMLSALNTNENLSIVDRLYDLSK